MHGAMVPKLAVVVLLWAICVGVAASSDVDTFSFPVFDATTMDNFTVTNNSLFTAASNLFEPNDPLALSQLNSSEGYLLLSPRVDIVRRPSGIPDREASFNSSFTLAGSSPVSFVVVNAVTLNAPGGLRGCSANATGDALSVGSLATVEAGGTGAGTCSDLILNVTVTPNGTAAPSRTVWIEYNATAHRVSVYVAAGGQVKPATAAINAPLNVAGRSTGEAASIGFFAGKISDIIVGVNGWELSVDALPGTGSSDGNKQKVTSWVAVLLAVVMSLAATGAI